MRTEELNVFSMKTPARIGHCNRFAVTAALLLLMLSPAASSQPLSEGCVVSVLNRTIIVKSDGSWVLPNIPANLGRVRARATCVNSGVTTSGQSDWFVLPPNGFVDAPAISFENVVAIPTRLILGSPAPVLDQAGATIQLAASAVPASGPSRDVTSALSGTNYTISNPATATVSPDGLVTAVSSGTVLITAMNDGASGMIRLQVVTSSDSDGDGLPDDVELANGMNPNDPVDAVEDFDRDGLTNRDEIAQGTGLRNPDTDADGLLDGREPSYGTDPLLWDTDGDGVSDGLEVQSGSNPTDPNSTNLGQVLQSISASPGTLLISYNVLLGETSLQLTVTGTLRDGRSIDLTSRSRGTNYSSSDLTIANFGGADGEVFAGSTGSATITVASAGFAAIVPVTVTQFQPRALATINIPGYANNVEVAGDFAYVAAGAAGLVVVDVANRASPQIAATLDTPGTAIDVRVAGSRVYLADGASGLAVFDVTNPRVPVEIGRLDTPGVAQDLVLRGDRAYVADGGAGVAIVDISQSASPRMVMQVATGSSALGLAASGEVIVVAQADNRLRTVSALTGAILGSVLVPATVKDVTVSGTIAYVAAYFPGSLQVVDFSNPQAPVLLPSVAQMTPRDFEISGGFMFGAHQVAQNAVPIVDVSTANTPFLRWSVDIASLGVYTGTGIAADGQYFYLTEQSFIVGADFGANGNTRLTIGQFLDVSDSRGLAPNVSIASPSSADVIEGSSVNVVVEATDDVRVAGVTLLVDGIPVQTRSAAPFVFDWVVPLGASSVQLSARAIDYGGNEATSASVQLTVVPDPPPTVALVAPAAGAVFTEGTAMEVVATATDNRLVSFVRFLIDGVERGRDTVPPYGFVFQIPPGANALSVVAEATDDLGRAVLSAPVDVTVLPDPPPAVSLTSPSIGGVLVEGAYVALTANASDNRAVTMVRFLVDGVERGRDTTPPMLSRIRFPSV